MSSYTLLTPPTTLSLAPTTTPIYLDNAATTRLDPEVLTAMLPYLEGTFGNPSSLHTLGRQAKVAIEQARKQVARLLGTAPARIFFTSGGTEADNTALCGAVRSLGLRHLITSPIEHHAVLHCAERLAATGQVQLHMAPLEAKGGALDMEGLDRLLASLDGPALVSLMHGNNEVGTINDLVAIGTLVRRHGGYLHSDTVQTMGHYPIELSTLPVDFLAGSAHKFHGPKGIGVLYVGDRAKIEPFICGGAQERHMRGGTENVAGAVGLAQALELAVGDMAAHRAHILGLKNHMMDLLEALIPGVAYNGHSGDRTGDRALYTVLNVSLPPTPAADMLLFKLDIEGVCASGGSACSSGSEVGSHVLNALYPASGRPAVRFSFSRMTTADEVTRAARTLARVLEDAPATMPVLAD